MSKVQENRIRRMATRQALALRGSAAKDPYSLTYGKFWLENRETKEPVFGIDAAGRPSASLDEIETYLRRPREER